jgi:hypothetical protein
MTGLAAVCRFIVPHGLVRHTERALRDAGHQGYERFVLWTGEIDGASFHARTCHVPQQTGYKTDHGLLVRVEGEALHQLNVWLYEHGQVLGAQVHAHPTEAFHSSTDDAYPIVTAQGGLSLVVPDFARRGVLCAGSAAYRLTGSRWAPVPLGIVEAVG